MSTSEHLWRRLGLLVLGAIWLLAVVSKLRAGQLFSLEASALHLPVWLPLWSVPAGEIALFVICFAAGLACRFLRPVALLNLIVFAGLLAFLVYEKSNGFGKYGCGCFGGIQNGIGPWDFVRDSLFVLASLALALPWRRMQARLGRVGQ